MSGRMKRRPGVTVDKTLTVCYGNGHVDQNTESGSAARLRPDRVSGLRRHRRRRDPDHVRRAPLRPARASRDRAVRGNVGDPGRLQAADRDARRGGKERARRGDGRRCRELAHAVRRLRRSRARPADERRDDRVPRSASRRRFDRGRHRRSRCSARSGHGRRWTARSSWLSITRGSSATRPTASASTSS